MLVFILILLLIAAIFGVLGAVLKWTLVLVLVFLLSMVVLAAIAAWLFRRQMRKLQAEGSQQVTVRRVIRYNSEPRPPGQLPGERDDRY
jgi:membrane protein implicated in regulation of membrane protease activity